ncbi:hypothetical protein [Paenibacillus phytohabitans]|uniref:hypothetical protein n=1 Tax=Paenibacillus phytohabitans TaxID=2654978 RepID=UPI0030089A64
MNLSDRLIAETNVLAARRALFDYHRSTLPSGMLQNRYSSEYRQVIPSFSLYLIHMLDEHFWHFGDRELICRYVPTMTGVLDWFRRKLTPEGLVGPTSQAYWPYFDWCKDCELGTPPAHAKGPLTLLSQLYASELHTVARIYEAVGWKDASREANTVNEALLRFYGDWNADCSRTDPRWRILAKTRRYGASSAAQYREKML